MTEIERLDDAYVKLTNTGYKMAQSMINCSNARHALAQRLVRISEGNPRCSTTGQLAAWMQTEALAGLEELKMQYPTLPMFMEEEKDGAH